MLQIWFAALYDFYFLVCAYIVVKPYIGMYSLATICAQCTHKKVVIIQ